MVVSGRPSRAGSCRPVVSELPIRVQDNNRGSMYATPQSKLLSFGKLSMSKPAPGTSEKRTTFFGARTSGASMPRSSIVGFGGTEKIKDTRPLHDKTFVQQCIRQLHEFLTEQGFPGTLSAKTLQSPSTKEFVKIFEFIYCQLDPTFEMPKSKVEEEVPALLKALGYPFVLSKCSMYSVGAPHTWPQALSALMWLIDNVKIQWSLSKQERLFPDSCEDVNNMEEGAEYRKLFLDYTVDSYAKFMQGQDTFEEENEVFLSKLKKHYKVDEALLLSEEEKLRILSGEVKRLSQENQTDRLLAKRMEMMKLQADLKNLMSYRSNMASFKANLENNASELKDELGTTVSLVESLKHERGKLQHILQNQKFTPADVERINAEKRELQQTIAGLTKSLEEAEQHKWNEEIALSKGKEKVDLKLTEYNKLARKLKLLPQSAENACGHDFEIRSLECGPGSAVQHNAQIQMLLRKFITDVEEENSRQANLKLSLEESTEQVTSNIMDKSSELKQLREQIRKLDERLESNMQELAREEQDWEREIESVENHRKRLEEKVNFGYDEAVQQLKAAQQQYHLVLQETSEERRIVTNNLTSIFTTAANQLSVTEKCMEELHSRVQRITSKAIEEDEAAVQRMKEMLKSFKAKANDL